MNRFDCVRILHQPSGETVVIGLNGNLRTARAATAAGLRVLRSRLWARSNGLGPRSDVVRELSLDWDFYSPFPFDMDLPEIGRRP